MDFRLLPAGKFRMGARGYDASEEPIHTVRITRPFYMGVYPVTQAQFRVWTTVAEIQHKNGFSGDNRCRHPAENLDWLQASAFCIWLNETHSESFPAGYHAGLPTEAQWEYACRAGSDTDYHTGDGKTALAVAGWYAGNAESETHPVGTRAANAFGLYDMHGNVWEWCLDAWDADAYKQRISGICDPMVTASDVRTTEENADRVIRGGSWFNSAGFCRASYRFGWRPVFRDWNRGFRVCLFFGPVPIQTAGTAEKSEPESGDAARRQAAAESQDTGGDASEVDLSAAKLPKRSAGTKF